MKKILSIIVCITVALSLTACGKKADEAKAVNFYVLSGPTGIGSVNLKANAESEKTEGKYNITVVTSPDEIVAKLSNGEADIAAIATNLASKLYNKTSGGITVLAVNTLGVLNVVTPDGIEIKGFEDIKGKKIITTGQGSNPEFIIKYLLKKYGIENDVTVDFKAEASELLTAWATEPQAVIIAPQPVATSLTVNFPTAKIALDLTDEWQKLDESSKLMMGCIVARTEFLNKNTDTVKTFLKEYKASVKETSDNTDLTAELCEKYGILPKAQIAKKAIPYCNVCFIDGNEMKKELSGYLDSLYGIDKSSVGANIPKEDFYYVK